MRPTNRSLFRNAALALFALLALAADARAVSIAWSPVGNAGNANDGTGFGRVNYAYNIGTYDVTNNQYIEFLNSNDPTGANSLGLYNSSLGSLHTDGFVTYNSGAANGSKYSLTPFGGGAGNLPVNNVNWYDAIRFANWLNNGQIPGSTETGAYTLLGGTPTPSNGLSITRNAGARIFLPSENEWYKAAYYNPATSSYYRYPTSSNTAPTPTIPTATPNSANYDGKSFLTNVGAYTGTTSPYGAFDMGGDVAQWDEALIGGSTRGVRGVSFYEGIFNVELSSELLSSTQASQNPTYEFLTYGFRMASIIPEPSSVSLAVMGLVALAACGCRRRRSLRSPK